MIDVTTKITPAGPSLVLRFQFVLIFLCLVQWGPACHGQDENLRYELGKRVQRYELQWEKSTKELRAASTDAMERAVRQFFGLDLAGAAKSIDDAWLAMLPSPTSMQRDSATLSLSSSTLLIDSSTPKIKLMLKSVYPTANPNWDSSSFVECELNSIPGASAPKRETKKQPLPSLPLEWEWQLPEMEPGDYRLSATLHHDGVSMPVLGTQVSIIKDKQIRLQAIATWVEDNKKSSKTSAVCTARMLGRQLLLADRGKDFECDIPMSHWFQEFESIAFSTPTQRPLGPNGRWQVLTDGKAEQVVRIQLPSQPAERTTLVIAFHGAGGSENMFFEAYGAGRLVELAKSRNWVVVCPRQGLTGLNMQADAMIPALEKELNLAFDRVFLVGHSMGAAQAIEQVSRSQERITAVAAIGGGGNPRRSDGLQRIPFFVSAGERDFGRPGAKKLSEKLQGFSCKVDYSEYADVEHLTIVQACLDELFRFLDRQ